MNPQPSIAPAPPAEAGAGAPPRRGLLVALTAVIVLLVIATGLLAFRLGGVGASDAVASPSPTPTPSPTPPSVSEIFQRVAPSVVVVEAGDHLGTGVIVGDDATILTANHVIAEADELTLTFSDGTKSGAVVVSADPATDIATLLPDTLPEILVPAVLGGGAAVGAPVVAIGNPLGLAYSVSTGVVAGLDRTADTDAGDFSGLIQFDASVNPGSSGGPLLDSTGSVIGIVVSIADPGHDDSWSGIGFAVPIGAALGGSGPGDGPGRGPQM